MSEDGSKWIAGNPTYLVSVKRLSAVFRGKFLSTLEKALNKGKLIGDVENIRGDLRRASAKSFVVYAKQPFGGPEQVLKYLGRYTHRVGISEQRIISFDNNQVKFTWLDRKNGQTRKVMCLSLEEFIRKFMLQLLPKAFRKIRYFGYMGNRHRKASIERVRKIIDPTAKTEPASTELLQSEPKCPHCGQPLRIRHRFEKNKYRVSRGLVEIPAPGPEPGVKITA